MGNEVYTTGEIECENGHINKWQRIPSRKDFFGRPLVIEWLSDHVQIVGAHTFNCRVCGTLVDFDEQKSK